MMHYCPPNKRNVIHYSDATSSLPIAVVISVSSALGVILVFLLFGALLGYIIAVKKILSQIAAGSKQTVDMETLYPG